MRAMFSKYLWLVIAGGLLAGSSVYASKVLERARLIVEDGAGMFSDDAKAKAKATVNEVLSGRTTEVHLETYAKLSESDQKTYKQIEEKKDEAARKQFWVDWMKDKVRGDKGIVILINKSPGHVHVVADRQTHEGGFTREKESTLQSHLLTGFREAGKKPEGERQTSYDKTLLDAADYLKHNIPTAGAPGNNAANHAVKKEEGGWQSWLCIGLCVLLGVWLVVGLIRAFSGGGGGGYGPGGGGGGFMSGLFGGLFGAMAGMWLYNSMFGHDTSSAYGGDTGGMGGDTGAGDFSGSEGSGGDFDSGGSGGDTGGGDWGGGGDFGGGGGDWGGGGDF